jgi:hypothetical protein
MPQDCRREVERRYGHEGEWNMNNVVRIEIPVSETAAKILGTPERREAVGRYVSNMLDGGKAATLLAEAIAGAKTEARASGLTSDTPLRGVAR